MMDDEAKRKQRIKDFLDHSNGTERSILEHARMQKNLLQDVRTAEYKKTILLMTASLLPMFAEPEELPNHSAYEHAIEQAEALYDYYYKEPKE